MDGSTGRRFLPRPVRSARRSEPYEALRLRGGGECSIAKRQAGRAVDVQARSRLPRRIRRRGEVFDAAEELGECDLGFEASQRGAEAEVRAVAKGDVRVGIAGNVETLGLLEGPGVVVGRADHGEDERAGG